MVSIVARGIHDHCRIFRIYIGNAALHTHKKHTHRRVVARESFVEKVRAHTQIKTAVTELFSIFLNRNFENVLITFKIGLKHTIALFFPFFLDLFSFFLWSSAEPNKANAYYWCRYMHSNDGIRLFCGHLSISLFNPINQRDLREYSHFTYSALFIGMLFLAVYSNVVYFPPHSGILPYEREKFSGFLSIFEQRKKMWFYVSNCLCGLKLLPKHSSLG